MLLGCRRSLGSLRLSHGAEERSRSQTQRQPPCKGVFFATPCFAKSNGVDAGSFLFELSRVNGDFGAAQSSHQRSGAKRWPGSETEGPGFNQLVGCNGAHPAPPPAPGPRSPVPNRPKRICCQPESSPACERTRRPAFAPERWPAGSGSPSFPLSALQGFGEIRARSPTRGTG